MAKIVTSILCLGILFANCEGAVQQSVTQQEAQDTAQPIAQAASGRSYDNLDSRSKKKLVDRAKYVFRLQNGALVDISNRAARWRTLSKNVVTVKSGQKSTTGGFTFKKVTKVQKALRTADDVRAYQHGAMSRLTVFLGGAEQVVAQEGTRSPNQPAVPGAPVPCEEIYLLNLGGCLLDDYETEVDGTPEAGLFRVTLRVFGVPSEVTNSVPTQVRVIYCEIPEAFIHEGKLKAPRGDEGYVLREKLPRDKGTLVERRVVEGRDVNIWELVDANDVRVPPAELHDLIEAGEFKLLEWSYKVHEGGSTGTPTTYTWAASTTELTYKKNK